MQSTTGIGSTIHIKGTISAQEPLTIAGQVVGAIDVPEHVLTLTSTARIDGDVTAAAVIVGGEVRGQLQAASRIVVEETALVEGTLMAPSLSVALGATLKGDVSAEGSPASALRLAS